MNTDKQSEFSVRTPAPLRLGYRVWRVHTARNMKKTAWLTEAITEKVERDERDLNLPPLPRHETPDL